MSGSILLEGCKCNGIDGMDGFMTIDGVLSIEGASMFVTTIGIQGVGVLFPVYFFFIVASLEKLLLRCL